MVPRPNALELIARAFRVPSIAALLGPRQCGKTTLARMIEEQEPCTYFDLENPVDIRRLSLVLLREIITTEAPFLAIWSTVALPKPLVAPVITTVLSFIFCLIRV